MAVSNRSFNASLRALSETVCEPFLDGAPSDFSDIQASPAAESFAPMWSSSFLFASISRLQKRSHTFVACSNNFRQSGKGESQKLLTIVL